MPSIILLLVVTTAKKGRKTLFPGQPPLLIDLIIFCLTLTKYKFGGSEPWFNRGRLSDQGESVAQPAEQGRFYFYRNIVKGVGMT